MCNSYVLFCFPQGISPSSVVDLFTSTSSITSHFTSTVSPSLESSSVSSSYALATEVLNKVEDTPTATPSLMSTPASPIFYFASKWNSTFCAVIERERERGWERGRDRERWRKKQRESFKNKLNYCLDRRGSWLLDCFWTLILVICWCYNCKRWYLPGLTLYTVHVLMIMELTYYYVKICMWTTIHGWVVVYIYK